MEHPGSPYNALPKAAGEDGRGQNANHNEEIGAGKEDSEPPRSRRMREVHSGQVLHVLLDRNRRAGIQEGFR